MRIFAVGTKNIWGGAWPTFGGACAPRPQRRTAPARKDERLSWPRKAELAYSAIYMNQTRDQQRFTISEVASDWHEPMVPQRIMWPSTARANEQLDPRCS